MCRGSEMEQKILHTWGIDPWLLQLLVLFAHLCWPQTAAVHFPKQRVSLEGAAGSSSSGAGAGAGVPLPGAKVIQAERLVQRARAAPVLSPRAGAPGTGAASRSAILCMFHVFLIQSFGTLIRSLWQHSEPCVCVLHCPGSQGSQGTWGHQPGLEPASPTGQGRPGWSLWRGFHPVLGQRSSISSLFIPWVSCRDSNEGWADCRACASALPFSLKQFPCPLAS